VVTPGRIVEHEKAECEHQHSLQMAQNLDRVDDLGFRISDSECRGLQYRFQI